MDRTERDLIDAIIETPGDDLCRLVYADWLEEDGKAARAEGIRLQIELARIPEPAIMTVGYQPQGEPGEYQHGLCKQCRAEWKKCRWHALAEREAAIFNNPGLGLCVSLPPGWLATREPFSPDADRDRQIVRVTRGFVSEVRCPLATWLELGPGIAESQPLERVELSDRGAMDCTQTTGRDGADHGWQWLDRDSVGADYPWALPHVIWRLLPLPKWGLAQQWKRADTVEEARAALSAVCILWARSVTLSRRAAIPSAVPPSASAPMPG